MSEKVLNKESYHLITVSPDCSSSWAADGLERPTANIGGLQRLLQHSRGKANPRHGAGAKYQSGKECQITKTGKSTGAKKSEPRHTLDISAFRRLRRENHEFEASPSYTT